MKKKPLKYLDFDLSKPLLTTQEGFMRKYFKGLKKSIFLFVFFVSVFPLILFPGCSSRSDTRQNQKTDTKIVSKEKEDTAATPQEKILLTSEHIQLKESPGYPGVQSSTLFGNPDTSAMFVVRLKFPPNYVLGPHTHSDARSFTVLSGTWYSGYGKKADCDETRALPVGNFSTIPPNTVHFDCVGSQGAVIQLTGVGPKGTTEWLNKEDIPKNRYADEYDD